MTDKPNKYENLQFFNVQKARVYLYNGHSFSFVNASECMKSYWKHEPLYDTRPFVATIFGKFEDERQDVFCYVLSEDDDTVDVEIKMPLYVLPSALRSDVQTWLWEVVDKKLGNLKFSIAPQDKVIAP